MTRKPPPRRRTPAAQLQVCNAVLRPLAAKYLAGMTWQAIGAEIGLSGAVIYRAVVRGVEPKRADDRRALGLPVTAPAPVCAACGVPHTRVTCPRKHGEIGRKPRRRATLAALAAWRRLVEWLVAWATGQGETP